MIANLQPYPAYKDSGVPWLGEVPEHWEVHRVRSLFRVLNGATPSSNEVAYWDGDIAWVTPDDLGRLGSARYIAESARRITQRGLASCAASMADPGAIVLSTRAPVGHLAVLKTAACVNQGCRILVPNAKRPAAEFWHYQLLTARPELQSLGQGTTFTELSRPKLLNVRLALPPGDETDAIVRFLDYVDRRVRRYVRAKRRLIELLEEQKQAIIQSAVTRGLDPDVPLRPSAVAWLGDIPKHWEVKKLHRVTDLKRPVMYGIVLPGPHVDEGVFIVKGGNCEPGKLKTELLSRTTFQIESRYARSRLQRDDIVFAIRGGVGAAESVPAELEGANMTQDAARIAAGPGINPRWLLNTVRAPVFQHQVQARTIGATVRGINIRDLKRVSVAVPPSQEQASIASHLDASLTREYGVVARAEREIELITEYRTRLITDVVTGKLDVREAAAALPNEPEEEPDDVSDDAELGDELNEELEMVAEEVEA